MRQDLIPVPRAAIETGMTAEKLRRRVQAGTVDGAMIDGKYYVTEAALEQLLQAKVPAVSAQ